MKRRPRLGGVSLPLRQEREVLNVHASGPDVDRRRLARRAGRRYEPRCERGGISYSGVSGGIVVQLPELITVCGRVGLRCESSINRQMTGFVVEAGRF